MVCKLEEPQPSKEKDLLELVITSAPNYSKSLSKSDSCKTLAIEISER